MTLQETIEWVAALGVREVRGTEFAVVVGPVPNRNSPGAVATDPLALHLYEAERAADDGPFVNTLGTGLVSYVERTTAPTAAWPRFRAACAQQGVLSVLVVPLEVAGARIGALGLYAESAHAYPTDQVDVAVDFAAAAAVVLTNAADYWSGRARSESLAAALESRAVIDQAKGVVMHTMMCGPDEAFRLLVEQSNFENRKVRDIAVEIVARTTDANRRNQQHHVDQDARRVGGSR